MSSVLTALLLPPTLFLLLAIGLGLLAWRGRRSAGLLAVVATLGVVVLSTPLAAGLLQASLEREVVPQEIGLPGAIIILGGDVAHGRSGTEIGLLTLERLRAGAALHRRTGLPILVTGGALGPGQPPLAELMARSLQADFGVAVRWLENSAIDTRGNAVHSARILRGAGIESAWIVSQAWHLPRARDAFARLGFAVRLSPVRYGQALGFEASDLVPRPTYLGDSWYAIREWAGRLVYRLRDGPPAYSAAVVPKPTALPGLQTRPA